MNFENLARFIINEMRMSHIYQPVMLMTLLSNGGHCDETEIAKDILGHDRSQIEYYTKITNNMVGRVLRRHGLVEKKGKTYQLVGFGELSLPQIAHLKSLCQRKLVEYMEKRGDNLWQHRNISSGYVSGSIKYEVLKRARFHCELCGVSAEERALEVDHIVPRSKGGLDDNSNYQALCYRCNAMKRDRDDTDFRSIKLSYEVRDTTCPFCNMQEGRIVAQNQLAYLVRDAFPVTNLHSLIIPQRHVQSYFELGQSEINACNRLLDEAKKGIQSIDGNVSGFNIGINDGADAGQTIFHCHIHLIPRRAGDVDNPRGGIRHTIAGKGYY